MSVLLPCSSVVYRPFWLQVAPEVCVFALKTPMRSLLLLDYFGNLPDYLCIGTSFLVHASETTCCGVPSLYVRPVQTLETTAQSMMSLLNKAKLPCSEQQHLLCSKQVVAQRHALLPLSSLNTQYPPVALLQEELEAGRRGEEKVKYLRSPSPNCLQEYQWSSAHYLISLWSLLFHHNVSHDFCTAEAMRNAAKVTRMYEICPFCYLVHRLFTDLFGYRLHLKYVFLL